MGRQFRQDSEADRERQSKQQKKQEQHFIRGRESRVQEEPEILNVLYTNAQSLASKLEELTATAEILSPDIILLTETWTNSTVNNANMTIPGYRIEERLDRSDTANGIGGGLIIYVKDKYVTVPYTNNSIFNQYTGIILKTNSRQLTFLLIYRPPSSGSENTEELCKLISDLKRDTFIIGDFNMPGINWNAETADAKGRMLLERTAAEGLEQLVDFKTHVRGNILDLVLTNSPEKVISVTDEGRLGRSDHCMILVKIESSLKTKVSHTKITCWKRGNYENIRWNLQNVRWHEMIGSKNIEDSWNIFKKEVGKQVAQEIPNFIPSGKQKPKWLTREILRLISQKKKAWKKVLSNSSVKNETEYNDIAKKLKKSITSAKRKLEKELANNKKGNGQLFRQYIKQRTRSRDPVGPLTGEDGGSVTEDLAIAEQLNRFFASVFTKEDRANIPVQPSETDKKLDKIHISPNEVVKKLQKLRPDSAAGPDNIHPRLLKECCNELSIPLTIIFRKSLREGRVPADWKTATVTPIFKKGKRTDPSNYRPVSLTSVPCKILESIIKDNLMNHLLTNNLIRESQHGFMPNRSCATNLIEFMEVVTKNVDEGHPVDIFYLDFSKAFDTVPHERLMIKLAAKGVAGEVTDWLRDWLTGRTQRVRVGDELSESQDVESGVPQGTVMGPCLFDVYIDDLDEVAELLELLSKFADDSKGLKTIKSPADRQLLQETVDKLGQWAAKWGMSFNKNKCKIMHVGNGNPKYEYYMQGTKLATVEEEKDVGVIIHSSLKPTLQCRKAAATGLNVLHQLRKNFHFRDRNVFLRLYKQYVRPHVEFATPAWNPWHQADIQVLENVQKKFVNMVAGLSPGSYEEKCVELGLDTLEERRKNQDLMQAYKMIRGKEQLSRINLFRHVDGGRTRMDADPLNIKQSQARLEIRKNFFSQRIIKNWNAVPTEIKNATTVAGFRAAKMKRNGPGGMP
jgi:Reverse transcriptase (RNA-dependent DNA polymerase)/Endonuclease-reverse transcriptase